MPDIELLIKPWQLAVCKLATAELPIWATGSAFICFSKTPDETSLVCESAYVPEGIKAETDWQCLQVAGTLDFSLVGIIAALTQILAAHKISVFVISSYDTDYLLIKQVVFAEAVAALRAAGYNCM